jgi:hypothetical protein
VQFGIPFLCAGIFVPISMLISVPRVWYWVSLLLILLGFALFAKAKFSMIKKGKLLTFGTMEMAKADRAFYIAGYVLMSLGLLLSIILVAYISVLTKS